MTRLELASALRAHDWDYAYSEDHAYWRRGTRSLGLITRALSALDAPFTIAEARIWAEDHPARRGLLTVDRREELSQWFALC